MSNMDPVSDLLTRLRNAQMAKHDRLDVASSRLKVEICKILKDQGFIRNFRVIESRPQPILRVYLEYDEAGVPAIRELRRISKPGRRVYRAASEIRPVRNGRGVSVISTNRGVLSDAKARELRVGGEVLCEVW